MQPPTHNIKLEPVLCDIEVKEELIPLAKSDLFVYACKEEAWILAHYT